MTAEKVLLILALTAVLVVSYPLAGMGKPAGQDKTVYVESIAVELTSQNANRWEATAQVTILDKNGTPIEDVRVTGDWDVNGTVFQTGVSGNTNEQGLAEISSDSQRAWGGHVFTFTVANVTCQGCVYNETDNAETCDSAIVPLPNDEVSYPFQGIKRVWRRTNIPHPLNINVLEVDLNEPAINFFVTPGGQKYDVPDTDIQEEVLARRTTTFVTDYGLQVGINGDFAASASDSPYEYQPRIVLGLAVSNGAQYSTDDGWPALTLPKSPRSGTAYIGHAPFPADVYNAIGGNKMLVENGQPVKPSTWYPIGGAFKQHPRTSSGLSADGEKLIIVVIDGRQQWFSEGVTLPEMSEYLIEFGVYIGLNHDGGGSSTLVFESADGSPTIINYPSDATGERIVSNHLGIISAPMLAQTNFGDINNDGNITAHDALLILEHIVELITLSAKLQQLADVSNDGAISALDAVLILQYAAGLITNFPVDLLNSALVLNAELESEMLIEAISELEKMSLNRGQKWVLEQLKLLVLQRVRPVHNVLLQNYPNPFNPETWIPYQLAQDADVVTISIYNIKGQLIRTINLGSKSAGVYTNSSRAAHWNGLNQSGEPVSSGIHFYTIKAGNFIATRRMMLVK